jgi:hypothetical protein
MTSSDRCDRILALIDACLDEVARAPRPPVPAGEEPSGRSNVIPMWWRDSVGLFVTRSA